MARYLRVVLKDREKARMVDNVLRLEESKHLFVENCTTSVQVLSQVLGEAFLPSTVRGFTEHIYLDDGDRWRLLWVIVMMNEGMVIFDMLTSNSYRVDGIFKDYVELPCDSTTNYKIFCDGRVTRVKSL